jgi:S1-C subfamily serine protease
MGAAAPIRSWAAPEAAAEAMRSPECPRCGYRCERPWKYCPSCGWDLEIPVGEAATQLLETVGRSVVGVIATFPKDVDPDLEMLIKKYHVKVLNEPGQTRAFATAYRLGGAGLFVTSAHLLEGASGIQVRTFTNQILPASIVALDVPSGVGLIKADLAAAALRPGEGPPGDGAWVVCMPVTIEEEPINLVRYWPQSLHRGRITGTGETGTGLVTYEDLLRTDHSIPSSCQGGPLLDLRGSVRGLIAGSPDTGLSYAVPVGAVVEVADLLARNERPPRPYFGMGLVAPDEWRRTRLGIPADERHAVVPYVIPGSPAERAGVRPGDLLVQVDGEEAPGVGPAGRLLLKSRAGGPPVRINVRRQGASLEISLAPVDRPARIFLAPIDELREGLEASLEEVTTGPTSQHGLRIADLVSGGRGDKSGYRRGDLIVAVNDRAVRRFDTFNEAVRTERRSFFANEAGRPIYVLSLDVKADGKDRESRRYRSVFPGTLVPPVY